MAYPSEGGRAIIEEMSAHAKILDPICDMVVDVAEARDAGLTLEMPDREYAFCSGSCLAKFAKSPQLYRSKVDAWLRAPEQPQAAPHAHGDPSAVIDEGMRRWYKSCRCCLSEAYPQVVKILDTEGSEATPH